MANKKPNNSIDLEYLWNYLKGIFLTKADFSNKMDKSVYDTNDNGKVDESESVTCDDVIIRFGIDSDGNYGYKKAGADTVTPFKTGSDPKLQRKIASPAASQQTVSPDTGYDGLEEVIIEGVPGDAQPSDVKAGRRFSGQNGINAIGTYVPQLPNLQPNKTVSPSISQQIITPDEGYDGLEQVTVNAATKQSKSVTPTNQQQVITPDSGYYGLSDVTVGAALDPSDADATSSDVINGKTFYAGNNTKKTGSMTELDILDLTSVLTGRTINVTQGGQYSITSPGASKTNRTPGHINGYNLKGDDVTINVNVPSSNLQTKTTTVTPTANWSGSETQAASITPDSGYDGMSQVNVKTPMIRDYCLVTPSGVDTPSTVYDGDTSQSNSQKLLRIAPSKTGMAYTNSYLYLPPTFLLGTAAAGDVRSGKTFSSINGIEVTGTWDGGGGTPTLQNKTAYPKMLFNQTIVSDSGYDGLNTVTVKSVEQSATVLWSGSATSQFAAQTITLSESYQNFSYIRIVFNVNKNKTTSNYVEWWMKVSAINAMNSTSSNNFHIASKAITSDGSTSGSMYYRPFRFASNTSITFAAASTAGGTSSSNALVIVSVEGLK